MAIICPTITATSKALYQNQMNDVAKFAKRIHVDLADGVFAPTKLVDPKDTWWPVGITADVHLMYETSRPFLKDLIALEPHMIILHAESVGNFYELAQTIRSAGIKVGVALLEATPVSKIRQAIDDIDHVLIFSGDLGYFGGHANLSLLQKVTEIKRYNASVEIGWDGGINESNVHKLVLGGVDVLNVGGAIHLSKNPMKAYNKLKALAESSTS
jgi:ribulose-phosphate 3-epimerase